MQILQAEGSGHRASVSRELVMKDMRHLRSTNHNRILRIQSQSSAVLRVKVIKSPIRLTQRVSLHESGCWRQLHPHQTPLLHRHLLATESCTLVSTAPLRPGQSWRCAIAEGGSAQLSRGHSRAAVAPGRDPGPRRSALAGRSAPAVAPRVLELALWGLQHHVANLYRTQQQPPRSFRRFEDFGSRLEMSPRICSHVSVLHVRQLREPQSHTQS